MIEIQEGALEPQLDLSRFEVLDFIPVPMRAERMVMLRTLEEVLEDLDRNANPEEMAYLIKVRPRARGAASLETPPPTLSSGTVAAATPSPSLTVAQAIRDFDAEAPAEEPTRQAPGTGTGKAVPVPVLDLESIYLAEGKLNLPYLTRTAELLMNSGDYRLARNIYKTIANSGERTAMALHGIARCLEAEGKLEEAQARYEESIAYHPDPESYRGLASVLISLKKDQLAANVIERALQLRELPRPARFELCRTAGNCLSRAGKRAEAGRFYIKALEIQPESDEIHCDMGYLHLDDGRTQLAQASFEKAIALNPGRHQALTGLGQCALAEGNLHAASAWFARALKIEIRNPKAIFHVVKCAYQLKSYAVAETLVEEYLQVAEPDVHLLYSLAGLHYHLDRPDKTRATCRKILEMDPRHAGALELLKRLDPTGGPQG